MKDSIYLDHHATTPLSPHVAAGMWPWLVDCYANPSSEFNPDANRAKHAIQTAREQVAEAVGASHREVFFTGSATESINQAILGLARTARTRGVNRHQLVTSPIEHKAVLLACAGLQSEGFTTHFTQLTNTGRIEPAQLGEVLTQQTLLVTIQLANNEIGTLQDIARLSDMAHAVGALFHCDASQALGHLPLDLDQLDVDLLTLSGHKAYGPKGIGALIVRGGLEETPLTPLYYGGNQERGLRPGTENVAAIVGFGLACQEAKAGLTHEPQRLRHLRDLLQQRLCTELPCIVNGDLHHRLPHNLNLTFPGHEAQTLQALCPQLVLSTGSACQSGSYQPSHVLRAIGLPHAQAWSTLRFGLGRGTTEAQIHTAADQLIHACQQLNPS